MNQTRSARRPPALFICGNARGGTTLLVRLLDGHPDLLVLPTETQIYPGLATGLPARWLLRAAELAGWRSGVALLAHPIMARHGFAGREALAARLRRWVREYPEASSLDDAELDAAARRVGGPHEYWDAFLDVFCRFTGSTTSGKRYWVEKTPRAERFAAVSDAWCRHSCRFLHVVRDPRDFIASYLLRESRLGRTGHRGREIVRRCYVWCQSVAWCRHGIRTIAGRYDAVRYEDLVRDPAPTMAAVCGRIGIGMDAGLLTATRMGEPVRHNSSDWSAAGMPGEILPSRVGTFAESLSASEIEGVERLLGAQMEACGYRCRTAVPGVGASVFDDLDWRSRVFARVTARSQDAWRGFRLSFLGR